MARADRLERMDRRREEAEAEYRAAFLAALEMTAKGQWGLFGHTRDRNHQAKAKPLLQDLEERADEIADLRERLGLEPFALHAEFLAARGPANAHAVGEPRQAQAWLARLRA